ncbi:MAG: invasion associated locus B family protein [bacterium]
MKRAGTLALCTAGFLLAAGHGFAQTTDALVATKTDWSVFDPPESPKQCFGVSSPKETVNTRDGKPVSVKRSDILLFVTFHPGQANGETSFTGGYPFAGGSTVTLNVDGTKFEMVVDGEWAWPANTDDDAKVLAALQKGQSAILTGHSSKGTQTQDTFSLRGFTAAMTEAASRCK